MSDWHTSEPYRVGDQVWMDVQRCDLWSRLLALFGIRRTQRAMFVIVQATETHRPDAKSDVRLTWSPTDDSSEIAT